MSLSTSDALIFALFPGPAEHLEKKALSVGNFEWWGVAKDVIYARNTLYLSAALTAIAAYGAKQSETESLGQTVCVSATVLSIAVGAFSARRLYQVTSRVMQVLETQAPLTSDI